MSTYRGYIFTNFYSDEKTEEFYDAVIEDIFFQALKEYVTVQKR